MHFFLCWIFVLVFTEYIAFTGSKKKCKWDFRQTTGGSLMFTSSRPHGGLKLPWYLLPCSRAQAIQQVSGGHWWQLLDTGDWEADELGDTLLNLMLTSKEMLVDVRFDGNLDDTDCVMVKVRIMKGGNKAKSGTTASDFRLWPLQGPGPCPVQFENLKSWRFTEHHSPGEYLFPLFHCPIFCPFTVQLLDHPVYLQHLKTLSLTYWSQLTRCAHPCTDTALNFSDLFRFPVLQGFYSLQWTFQYCRSKWS